MKKLTAGIFATILGLTAVDAFAAVPATKTAVATTNYVAGALDAAKSYTDTAVADKAAQADLEALDGRVTTAEDKITTAEGEIDALQETVANKADASALTNYVLWDDVDNDFTQPGIQ